MYFLTFVVFTLSLNCICINTISVLGAETDQPKKHTVNKLEATSIPRIAIVGGGVGGSAAAYYLTKLFKGNIEIDLFEETSIIGGRLATQDIFGNEYETGGSIIHPKNKFAVDLVKELGLSQRGDTSSGMMTLVKDSEFIFGTSSWTLVTIWRILRRYGFDFDRMDSMTKVFLQHFEKIYPLFEKGHSFESVSGLLSAMSPTLLNLTTVNFNTFLTERDYKVHFIDELVQAICGVQYGQNIKGLHSLVGSVAVAGTANGLWSVAGGNKNLAIALLNHSNAQVHLNRKVVGITYLASKFELNFEDIKVPTSIPYDKIILSIPSLSSIRFVNFNAEVESKLPKSGKYHRTVSTIVAADSLQEKYKDRGSLISITPNFYTSVSRIHPVVLRVAEKVPVYKVFSSDLLTDNQIKELFLNPLKITVNDWLAYPQYDSLSSITAFSNFTLYPGIYHPNNIEWAASAIEMSLIGAKNVALIIHNSINENEPMSGSINEKDDLRQKTEF